MRCENYVMGAFSRALLRKLGDGFLEDVPIAMRMQ
tara:strand:+ start:924 stop:1028 length:105 start_codon:yes stop_codon:yes gene_type:complete